MNILIIIGIYIVSCLGVDLLNINTRNIIYTKLAKNSKRIDFKNFKKEQEKILEKFPKFIKILSLLPIINLSSPIINLTINKKILKNKSLIKPLTSFEQDLYRMDPSVKTIIHIMDRYYIHNEENIVFSFKEGKEVSVINVKSRTNGELIVNSTDGPISTKSRREQYNKLLEYKDKIQKAIDAKAIHILREEESISSKLIKSITVEEFYERMDFMRKDGILPYARISEENEKSISK